MNHAIQDIECPACTTLAGPCATTLPAKVAWPVFDLPKPVSMSKLVRVARALKVLYGGDLVHKESPHDHVWFTPGPECACELCDDTLSRLLEGPHDA